MVAPEVEPGESKMRGVACRVLGIDPGTRVAGYGVLDMERGRRPAVVAHGAIRLPASPMATRLEALYREVRAIIAAHAPGVLAIERVFHGKNFQSVLKVGEARGVVVLAAQMAGLEIREYTPARIKKAATGNGNAPKDQVQRMMGRILGLAEPPAPLDAADALAAAFCHGGMGRAAARGPGAAPRRRRMARPVADAAAARQIDLARLLRSGKARVVSKVSYRKAASGTR